MPTQLSAQDGDSVTVAMGMPVSGVSDAAGIAPDDLFYLRSASDPQLSPDGRTVLFEVKYVDRIGNPYTRIWSHDTAIGVAGPWGSEGAESGSPRWSPDGRTVTYRKNGSIMLAGANGAQPRTLAVVDDTNQPLPRASKQIAWSPDGAKIAFVSEVPSNQSLIVGDPIVVDFYSYRPANGWPDGFVDKERVHLCVADVVSGKVRQLTDVDRCEHSLDWLPDSRALLYFSNSEDNPDQNSSYDVFTIDVKTGARERLSDTRGVEYAASWSLDGRTIAFLGLVRAITSSETNMEEPHIWTLDVASGQRRDIGSVIDSVQSRRQWSSDRRWLYTTVQERGSVGFYRLPVAGGAAERVGPDGSESGVVRYFALARDGAIIAAMATAGDLTQLYRFPAGSARPAQLTDLNHPLLKAKKLGEVEAFTITSYDDPLIDAFMTRPIDFDPKRKYPLIVMIYGGPHGQQGPDFRFRNQAFANAGYASLVVNYRSSARYGQSLTNLIARDQNGGEAKDVMAGVDAAIARYDWIDPDRLGIEGGSYGGQLTNWIITQTPCFKAAVPWASISSFVSHNYISVFHDYLEQEYFGKPHTNGLMDMLWIRSAIRFVDRVRTPTLLSHGDNDLLVNTVEIEQFYIALRDIGVEVKMLRYPREWHDMTETQHIVDFTERSIDWCATHFAEKDGKRRQYC